MILDAILPATPLCHVLYSSIGVCSFLTAGALFFANKGKIDGSSGNVALLTLSFRLGLRIPQNLPLSISTPPYLPAKIKNNKYYKYATQWLRVVQFNTLLHVIP